MLQTIKFCKVRVCEEERRLFYSIPLKTISEQTPTQTHLFLPKEQIRSIYRVRTSTPILVVTFETKPKLP